MRMFERALEGGLAALLVWGTCQTAWAGEIKVAVASSAQEALKEIASRFERDTGHQVWLISGSSGKFFTQLSQGAPFDLFFSADDEYPEKLYQLGLGEAPKRYAQGRIVLWMPAASSLDVKGGIAVLREARIAKVAIPNPKVAPYGRAAVEAMKAEGIYDAVHPKLVMGENVAQASQFVESGAAEIGVLPLSLAVSPKLAPRGTYWLVPSRLHAPINADASVVKSSPELKVARQFLDYCLSPKSEGVWRRFGLDSD